MSTLKELLKDVPVEWKALSSFSTIGTGNSNRQDENVHGKYPFYVRSKNVLKSDTFQFDEKAIVIPGEGGIGDIFHFVDGKYALHQRAYRIRIENEEILTKFVYYYMIENFKRYISSKSVGATATSIRKPMLEAFLTPIPFPNDPQKSLEIQQEIVRVLDSLSEQNKALTSTLAKEIEQRKKQYEFFSQKLFNFKSIEFESRKLGAFCDFTYGFAAKAEDSGNARFIRITDINNDGNLISGDKKYVSVNDENKRFLLEKNDILVARTGGTFGKTMIFNERYPAIYAGFLIKISFDKNVLDPKYYWHFAQNSEYWFQANKLVSGGGQPQFNANAVKEIKIPIPFPDDKERSILEQERIVHLLDRFNAATKSVIAELEKEIALRNQQYEYYRNLLLTFPKEN